MRGQSLRSFPCFLMLHSFVVLARLGNRKVLATLARDSLKARYRLCYADAGSFPVSKTVAGLPFRKPPFYPLNYGDSPAASDRAATLQTHNTRSRSCKRVRALSPSPQDAEIETSPKSEQALARWASCPPVYKADKRRPPVLRGPRQPQPPPDELRLAYGSCTPPAPVFTTRIAPTIPFRRSQEIRRR